MNYDDFRYAEIINEYRRWDTDTPDEDEEIDPYVYCQRCGRLEIDTRLNPSQICPECGQKVE